MPRSLINAIVHRPLLMLCLLFASGILAELNRFLWLYDLAVLIVCVSLIPVITLRSFRFVVVVMAGVYDHHASYSC